MLLILLGRIGLAGLYLMQMNDSSELVKNVGVPAAILFVVLTAIGWFFSRKFWPDIVKHWKAQESAATRAYESQCATLKHQLERSQNLSQTQAAENRADMERRELRWLEELARRDAILDRMQQRQDALFSKWSEEMQLMGEIVESLSFQIKSLDSRPVKLVVEHARDSSKG